MAKVVLLPSAVEKINEIVELNNIVSNITIECDTSSGIGAIITMSWVTVYKGLCTTMTVNVADEAWVGLTPEDYDSMRPRVPDIVNDFTFADVAAIVEAKLKEKNYG